MHPRSSLKCRQLERRHSIEDSERLCVGGGGGTCGCGMSNDPRRCARIDCGGTQKPCMWRGRDPTTVASLSPTSNSSSSDSSDSPPPQPAGPAGRLCKCNRQRPGPNGRSISRAPASSNSLSLRRRARQPAVAASAASETPRTSYDPAATSPGELRQCALWRAGQMRCPACPTAAW